jgi:hypothetical protein
LEEIKNVPVAQEVLDVSSVTDEKVQAMMMQKHTELLKE